MSLRLLKTSSKFKTSFPIGLTQYTYRCILVRGILQFEKLVIIQVFESWDLFELIHVDLKCEIHTVYVYS